MNSPSRRYSRATFVARIRAVICLAVMTGTACAVAQQPFQAQLRLLQHNVRTFSDTHCVTRSRAFGHMVASAQPAYDIVGLEEYYRSTHLNIGICNPVWLYEASQCTGRYGGPDQARLGWPAEGLVTSIDGGIGILTMGTICEFEPYSWSWQDFGDPAQGFIFARVAIPNTNVMLDVYVVHTFGSGDGCDRCCHRDEMLELAFQIQAHSARSGNPVIVMGDFNMAGPPACCGEQGYPVIKSILGAPRDLWWEDHPCSGIELCDHPNADCTATEDCHATEACPGAGSPTMNYCTDIHPDDVHDASGVTCTPGPTNCEGSAGYTSGGCLISEWDPLGIGERLDYLFVVDNPALSSSAFHVALVPGSAQVCNWRAHLSDGTDQHVSDHLGVEATIAIFGMSSVWVDSFAQSAGSGTSCDPFSSLESAVDAIPAGDRIILRQGLYPELLTINKHCRLQAVGGHVVIGF